MTGCRTLGSGWWCAAGTSIVVTSCSLTSPDRRSAVLAENEASTPRLRGAADSGGASVRTSEGDGAPAVATREPHGDKLVALAAEVAVYSSLDVQSLKLGAIRAGGAARLMELERTTSPAGGCPSGFYALQPRGFVCSDDGVTRDANDPLARLLSDYALARGAALPASYGLAETTPLYVRIPTAAEQARAEPGIERTRRPPSSESRTATIEVPGPLRTTIIAPGRPAPLAPDSPVVGVLQNHARIAWVAEFDEPDRSWLLTPELLFVASDRVNRAAVSGFHGIDVPNGKGVAFIGHQAVPRYVKSQDSKRFAPQKEKWLPLTPVLLAEPTPSWSEETYLETVEPGVYLRADEVIVAHPTPPSRWGLEPNATFVEIIATSNLLLLHRGHRVTFATVVSIGRGATARGKFRVFAKSLTAPSFLDVAHAPTRAAEIPLIMRMTDTPDRPNQAKAVPMYAAWWANRWGSAGAGNGVALAPRDARRIFDESEPALPEGWHAVQGDGTWVVIRE